MIRAEAAVALVEQELRAAGVPARITGEQRLIDVALSRPTRDEFAAAVDVMHRHRGDGYSYLIHASYGSTEVH